MQEEITDPFTDSIRYGVETFLNDKNAKWLKDRCPFKMPVTSEPCDIVANPLYIKPISVADLSKEVDILQENLIQLTMTDAILKVQNKIDEQFKDLLKRKGISEKEWKLYGDCSTVKNCQIFSFNHKPIFKIFFPDVKLEPGATEGKVSIYYEELD